MESMEINSTFWKDKNVLITGHTGFKGSWLSLFLKALGSRIHGIALKPENQSFFESISNIFDSSHFHNINDFEGLNDLIKKINPDIVFHLAAQSLVNKSYEDPIETYRTNVIGTLNILQILRYSINTKCIINVTSDKCYKNDNLGKPFKETDTLGGHDPYSSSKACVELLSESFRKSFLLDSDHSINLATVRAGNVIGGGDWSNNRLIPDIARSLLSKKIFNVRNPKSLRPWQHVFDPLRGYIILCQNLYTDNSFSGAWNFGPNSNKNYTVSDVVTYFKNFFSSLEIMNDNHSIKPYESTVLSLNSTKSKKYLNWEPFLDFHNSLELTAKWYEAYIAKKDMFKFSSDQLNNYLHNTIK